VLGSFTNLTKYVAVPCGVPEVECGRRGPGDRRAEESHIPDGGRVAEQRGSERQKMVEVVSASYQR